MMPDSKIFLFVLTRSRSYTRFFYKNVTFIRKRQVSFDYHLIKAYTDFLGFSKKQKIHVARLDISSKIYNANMQIQKKSTIFNWIMSVETHDM